MADAVCVHCNQVVATDVRRFQQSELQRLREHLIGCPPALRDCAPALPIFDREPELLRNFTLREQSSR
ncbi:MAG TPA: hypothetical protein VGK30_04940 [Candidatus Binatia bacterium]|jgi:hypothetical protein